MRGLDHLTASAALAVHSSHQLQQLFTSDVLMFFYQLLTPFRMFLLVMRHKG
jgi:hypothetical protein